MKVFMVTDMEGVAGVVSFEQQSYPDGKYYERAKLLEMAEVNAAVDGLLDAGVEEVLVWDGHGAGGIDFETLHPMAKLLHGRPSPPWSRLNEVIVQYDLCVMIGQHARAGVVTGNQNHTQSSRTIDYYKLNGKEIGEIAQIALYFGSFGIPLIFLSGEEDACREVEDLIPGITTAAVKQGLGRGSAISLSAQAARRRIREGTKSAIERQRIEPIPPLVWDGPFVLEKRYFHTDVADSMADRPGVERVDSQTVRLHSDQIREILYR
ncbi:MAG: M55 family metallopeptidase [Caldilineaceae bacterium]|nr:M55 family metallopeptidase [Caldilineaceae bacterium]